MSGQRPAADARPAQAVALEGLPARAALQVLETVELFGETRGTGFVASQRPPPGTVVERGARVRLGLRPRG